MVQPTVAGNIHLIGCVYAREKGRCLRRIPDAGRRVSLSEASVDLVQPS
jgi:hypothetical protein